MNIARIIFRLLLGRRLPTVNGKIVISGLKQPVTIRRDAYGIAYIDAGNDSDAWYGIGFCHGQDRAFQLEVMLRVIRGTMAELMGPPALPIDRLSRRIGFYHSAKEQYNLVSDEIRDMLESYARGATDGARIGCRKAAHEFTLLRTKPAPFTAIDVLGAIKLMSLQMTFNWDCELVRLKVLREDGEDALKALDHSYPVWKLDTQPNAVIAGGAIDRLAEDMETFMNTVGLKTGSNNWVIAPSRTATGRPILANDPHVGPDLPLFCYLAHVRAPGWCSAGAFYVGSPVPAMGHNGFAAWGMTAGMTDASDLFIEETGPDGKSVREGDGFVPCEIRNETINVKGNEPVTEQVLVTRRGPVIGPALNEETGAVSMSAVFLKPYPIEGLLSVHRVRSYGEFCKTFEKWPALPLNMVYADASGDIGWQLVGQVPKRKKGWGTIPLAGWDTGAGWEDSMVPLADMPGLLNPDAGFIATANNRPSSEKESRPFLGVDWCDGYRAARIGEALNRRRDWDIKRVMALQIDQLSLPWRQLRDTVLGLPEKSEQARFAISLLKNWDGVLSADSAEAAVYEFFLAEMIHRVTKARAPRSAQWILGKSFVSLMGRSFLPMRRTGHLVRVMVQQPAGWFSESWQEEMADGLKAAVDRLRKLRGKNIKKWGWGHIRKLTLPHPVGAKAPLGRIFNLGPVPFGGDNSTVAQACVDWLDIRATPLAIACLHMAIDVGNWDESRFAIPAGQSGNPLSPHYGDLLPLWLKGVGVPIAWSPEIIKSAARSELVLAPQCE